MVCVAAVSLSLNNWWSLRDSDTTVDSCASIVNCQSFCSETQEVDVFGTIDDYVVDLDYNPPSLEIYSTTTTSSYCIAYVSGWCAFKYWLLFRLVPLLMHVLHFVMQLLTWHYYGSFTPQQRQYDAILLSLFPEVPLAKKNECFDRGGGYPALIRRLRQYPRSYSSFSFIDMIALVYVWGELMFPAVNCGAVRALSLYYYPLVMTLLEVLKFNQYVAYLHWRNKDYLAAVVAPLNVYMAFVNLWISVVLAVAFIVPCAVFGLQLDKDITIDFKAHAAANPMMLGSDTTLDDKQPGGAEARVLSPDGANKHEIGLTERPSTGVLCNI